MIQENEEQLMKELSQDLRKKSDADTSQEVWKESEYFDQVDFETTRRRQDAVKRMTDQVGPDWDETAQRVMHENTLLGSALTQARLSASDAKDPNWDGFKAIFRGPSSEELKGPDSEGLVDFQKFATGIPEEKLIKIAQDSKNADHAMMMILRAQESKQNQEAFARAPGKTLTTSLIFGGGEMALGLGALPSSARVLATAGNALRASSTVAKGAKTFQLNSMAIGVRKAAAAGLTRSAKGIQATQSTIVRRGITGAAEGYIYKASMDFASISPADDQITMAILGGVLNGAFNRIDLPQLQGTKKVNGAGEVVEDVSHKGANTTGGPSRGYDNGGLTRAEMESYVEASVLTSQPKVGHVLKAQQDLETNAITKADETRELLENIKRRKDDYEAQAGSKRSEIKAAEADLTRSFGKGLTEKQREFFSKQARSAGIDPDDADSITSFIKGKEQEISTKFGLSRESVQAVTKKTDIEEVFGKGEKGKAEADNLVAARKLADDSVKGEFRTLSRELNIDPLKKELDALESEVSKWTKKEVEATDRLKNYDAKAEEMRVARTAYEKFDSDEVIDMAPLKYAGAKAHKARHSEIDPEGIFDSTTSIPYKLNDLRDIRRAAEDAGDDEMMEFVDKYSYQNTDGSYTDFKDIPPSTFKILDDNPGEAEGAWKDVFLQDLGQEFTRYGDDISDIMGVLLTSTQKAISGKTVASGADFLAEQAYQKANSKFFGARQTWFNEYMKSEGVGGIRRWGNRQFATAMPKYRKFSHETAEYLKVVDTDANAATTFHPAAVSFGNEYKKLVGDLRKDLIDNGWEAKIVDDLELSAFSRVRNDSAWRSAKYMFESDDVAKVFQGAVLKRNITADVDFKITGVEKRIAALGDKASVSKKANLEKKLDTLKAERADILKRPIDEVIEEILETSGASQSRALSRLYVENQTARATGREPNNVSGIKGETLDDAVVNATEETLRKLDPEDRAIVESLLKNRKKGSAGSQDIFKERVDMDMSYSRKLAGREGGEEQTVRVGDLFSDDIERVMHDTINRYSKAIGLAKKGYKNYDEFDVAMNEASKRAEKLPASQVTRAKAGIEMTRKHFKGQAQYDDSGSLNSIKRTLKKLTAAAKLGFLVFSLPVELATAMTRNGVTATMKVLPGVMRSIKDMATGLPLENGLVRDLHAAGLETMSPFYNIMGDMENGIFSGGTKGPKSFYGAPGEYAASNTQRALNSAENLASGWAHATSYSYKPVDMLIRRLSVASTFQNLVTLSRKNPRALEGQRYKDIGIDSQFIDELKEADNFITVKGGVVTGFDYDGLKKQNPKLADEFVVKVMRLADRQVQTSRFGQMPGLINNQLFSWFGQFKSFMLGTYNNQFKYDISQRDMQSAVTMITQTAVGAAMAYAREAARAALEGRENRMKDYSMSQRIAIGMRQTSIFALPMTLADTAYQMLTGNPFLSQYGNTGTNTPMMIQSVYDVVEGAGALGSLTLDPTTSASRDEYARLVDTFAPKWLTAAPGKALGDALDIPQSRKQESILETFGNFDNL